MNADELIQLLLKQNQESVAGFEPKPVGAPAIPPEMRAPVSSGMFGPAAPPTQTTTQVAQRMPFLQRLMLSLDAPNTPLSHRAGQARGQLFLRGLATGANRAGANMGRGQVPGKAVDPLDQRLKELSIQQKEYDLKNPAPTRGTPTEWEVGNRIEDQEWKREQAAAMAKERGVDNDRAMLFHGDLEAERADKRQDRHARLALAQKRYGLAAKKAASGGAASDKWPDAVKIPYQTRVKELFTIYDKDDPDDMLELTRQVDALTLEATRQAEGMAGIGAVRDPNKPTFPGPGGAAPTMLKSNAPGAAPAKKKSTLDILNGR